MKISIIVAVSTNGVIGGDNKLLWHLSTDLKRFKSITINKTILLGRKTFDSLGKTLPNRIHLVVSKMDKENEENVFYFKSINEAIQFAKQRNIDELVICGGGEIYKQTMALASIIYLTRVDTIIDGDTYFHLTNEWKLDELQQFYKDDKNEFNFTFEKYSKLINH